MDALKWTITKNAPKRYGDKNVTEIQGNVNQPVVLQVKTGVPRAGNSLIGGSDLAMAAPKIIEGVAVREKDAE
jgi:hypothetical protein